MANPNLQQRGEEQRREQEDRGRSLEINHPARSTQKASSGTPEHSKGLRGSTSSPKQVLKISFQKAAISSESFDIPRSTSPVSFKNTAPPLNLEIPGSQTRSQYQRRNLGALTGPMKIIKRHTSPYPTPASSPNGEAIMEKISPPRRSETCPANMAEKYIERMGLILRSNLISKVVDPSQSPPAGGDTMDARPALKDGLGAEPVPEFFVNLPHTDYPSNFDSAWVPEASGSPDSEHALMDTDFIGTLGSVQDLDEVMEGFLPGIFSEFFPGPDVPLNEPVSTASSQNMDSANVTGSVFLGNPGDSAVRRQLFTPIINKTVHEGSGVKASVASTNPVQYGAPAAGLGDIPFDLSQSFFAGELTPPNSAHLSPSPSSALFLSERSHAPFRTKKGLAAESMKTIETFILDPMLREPSLQEFWRLCEDAKEQMRKGKIESLKDVESMFLTTRGRTIASSSVSYLRFANASLQGIKEAARRVPECDLGRADDPTYNDSYFTDKFHEVKQVCVEDEKKPVSSGRNPSFEITSLGLGEQKRNMDQQNVGIPQESQRTRKRKHSATAETAMKPSVAACVTNEQKRKSFKPNSQQKQQLEIKTQPLDFYTYGHPQFFHNANFTHDQRTGNGIAQIESHNFRAYHNYSSEMLPPSVPPAVNLALVGGQAIQFYPPVTPVSASASSFPSPTGVPVTSMFGSTAIRSKSSTPICTPNTKHDTSTYHCELCEKTFPRPCDLTKHQKTHLRPFKCDIESCKYHIQGFPTNKERERHQNDIHSPDSKEWKCEFSPCQYKSKRESNCKQHMEKAHQYEYKRMKRNPRRRDQGVQATPSSRKRRNVQPTQQPPVTPLRDSPTMQQGESMPFQQSSTSMPLPEEGSYAPSFNYTQQPHLSHMEPISLLEPSQMQEINGSLLARSMGDHEMSNQSFYSNSPVTPTDYEPSPVTTAGSVYGDYSTALRGHPDTSPTLASENFFPTQSAEQYAEHFLSDFPNRHDGFGVTQQYSQPMGAYSYNSLDFGESMDCEREGDTPD